MCREVKVHSFELVSVILGSGSLIKGEERTISKRVIISFFLMGLGNMSCMGMPS
jgi:hypothetical protein